MNKTKEPIIGVLALQGDFKEHISLLLQCGVLAREVRLPTDLNGVGGLIIPGGESTAIGKLMRWYGLDKAIISHHKKGMAIWGTCAGAILLAKEIMGSTQLCLGLMDILIKRNEYGRQIDSFETEIDVTGIGKILGAFIRAPIIHSIGKDVEVLASHDGKPVVVRQGNLLASTFHPEVMGGKKIHEHFVNLSKS